MGARRIRREQVAADQKVSRRVNGTRKSKERDRRDRRMHEIIAKNKFPYVPSVMSWVRSNSASRRRISSRPISRRSSPKPEPFDPKHLREKIQDVLTKAANK